MIFVDSEVVYRLKSSRLQVENRMNTAAPPHPLVAQILSTFVLNMFDFESLQISFERVVEIGFANDYQVI